MFGSKSKTQKLIKKYGDIKIPASSLLPADKEGYIYKQSPRGLKSWQKRYFILKGSTLFYYKAPKDTEITGKLDLDSQCSSQLDIGSKRSNAFSVKTTKKSLALSADKEDEAKSWVEAINKATASASSSNSNTTTTTQVENTNQQTEQNVPKEEPKTVEQPKPEEKKVEQTQPAEQPKQVEEPKKEEPLPVEQHVEPPKAEQKVEEKQPEPQPEPPKEEHKPVEQPQPPKEEPKVVQQVEEPKPVEQPAPVAEKQPEPQPEPPKEEPKPVEQHVEQPKVEEPKQEEPKPVEQPKPVEEVKPVQQHVEQPKVEEPKKEEPKPVEHKPEEKKPEEVPKERRATQERRNTITEPSGNADIMFVYSAVTGQSAATALEGIKKVVGKLVEIQFVGCEEGPVKNPEEVDKQVSNIGTMVAVLSKDFLKLKTSVHMMECALKHKKRIVLVHDQATCFFPGEAEQPESLKKADVFHDKAITYMREYTDFVVKQVLKKALRAGQQMVEIALFHHESQQEVVDKFLKPFDKIKTTAVACNEKSGELPFEFAKRILRVLAISRSVVILLHENMVREKAIYLLREPVHLALMLNSQARVHILYDEDNTPVMLNAFAKEASSPEVRQFCRQGVVTLLDAKHPEIAAKSIIAEEKRQGGCRDETETHTRCFLSHKRSSAQGMTGRIYQGLKSQYKVFLDSEADFDLHDLTLIVKNTKLFVFILSAGILDSYWCLQELLSAYKEKKRFLIIRDWQYHLPKELPANLPVSAEDRVSLEKILAESPRIDYMAEFYEHCVNEIKEYLGPRDEIISNIVDTLKTEDPVLLKKLEKKLPGRRGVIKMSPILSSKVSLLDFANALDKYFQIDMKKIHTLDFSGALNISGAGMKAFGGYCTELRTLLVQNCKDLTDDALTSLSKQCKKLQSVDAGNCRQLTHRGVSALFANCSNLRHINLENCSAVKISAFKGLEKRCPKIERIELRGVYEIDKFALEFLGVCENIQKLDIANCSVDDEGMGHLHLKSLKELKLTGCTAITDNSLKHIAEFAPDLEVLDLADCSKLTDAGLKHLSEKCSKLSTLNLAHCANITADGIGYLASKCPNIKVLDLKNCLNMNDAAITRLTAGCKHLEKLVLNGCFLVNEDALKALGECKNLKDIDLSRISLSSSMLKELAKLSSLEKLRLKECPIEETEGEMQQVAAGLKNLKVIDLEACGDINDEHVEAFTTNCKNITTLILSNCTQIMAYDDTAGVIKSITSGCPGLEVLDLSNCWHVNDSALKKFYSKEGPRLKKIKKLSLKDCTEITNDGLLHISRGCPTLEYLDLSGLTALDESGMQFIGRKCRNLNTLLLEKCTKIASGVCQILSENCPRLNTVNLRGCQGIDDSGLNYLSEGCTALQHLNLYDCDSITDSGIKHLARGCPTLQSLNLAECDQITDTAVRYLASNCFQLRSLTLSGRVISDGAVKTLLQVCPSMESISLMGCRSITNDILKYISEACSNIQSITITGSPDISDLGLVNLVKCKRLTSLDLSGSEITDSGLGKFCEKNPKVSTLNLSRCSKIKDKGVGYLVRCRYLSVLDLSYCEKVGAAGVAKLAALPNLTSLNVAGLSGVNDDTIQALTKCKRLKTLELSETAVTDKACEYIKELPLRKEMYLRWCNVTPAGLAALVSGDTHLRGLAVSGFNIDDEAVTAHIKGLQSLVWLEVSRTNITDAALDVIKEIRTLYALIISENEYLTDAGIKKLSESKANLMYLDISGCKKLTNDAVSELPQSLRYLKLADCNLINDEGLSEISWRCNNLQELDISSCTEVTDSGIQSLASYCRNLFEIKAFNCDKITDEGVDYFPKGVVKKSPEEEAEDDEEDEYSETEMDEDEEDEEDEENEGEDEESQEQNGSYHDEYNEEEYPTYDDQQEAYDTNYYDNYYAEEGTGENYEENYQE